MKAFILVAVVAAVTVPLHGCMKSKASALVPAHVVGAQVTFVPDSPQLHSIAVAPVLGATADRADLCGRLVWDEDVTARVFTPFAGRVRRVLVDAGQRVAIGTPLAEVESPDFGQAQADARTAETGLSLAESNLARLRELFDHGAAARKDVEAAEAERARAEAERSRANARLAACGATAGAVDGIFLLRSPVRGVVVERNLTPGQEIRPDQMLANAPQLYSPLFVLSDPARLWIEIEATESDLALLHPSQALEFTTDAYPGQVFQGTMERVSEGIDPTTHTLRARGRVDNASLKLKAEMFTRVRLPEASHAAAAVSVPAGAVILHEDRHFVFVEAPPGTFTRREVQLDGRGNGAVTISDGLHRGERVVTEGGLLLEAMLD